MIPYGLHYLDEDDIQAVVAQLRRSLTQGPTIGEFEEALARYVGARYAVAVSNGTAALHLACAASGVGSGDTVLTSAMTFVASANCAHYVGARAAFADVDPRTLNMDPQDLERRCQGRVAAIIPVHFGGLPCDMPAIRAIAKRHGAAVIEDASHALGAVGADGERVGSCRHSDMTVFSFHPVKHITTGEGGMITTNEERLYRELLRLRSHGINKGDDPLLAEEHAYSDGRRNRWYYEMQELGFNYRLTEMQAALGLSQLKKLDRFLERRRALVAAYDRAFAEPIRPAQAEKERSAHHLYIVRVPFGRGCVSRNEFMERLYAAGYVTQVHYIPVPLHPYYRNLGHRAQDYPNTWAYYREALSIPLYFSLSDADQARFVEAAQRLIR